MGLGDESRTTTEARGGGLARMARDINWDYARVLPVFRVVACSLLIFLGNRNWLLDVRCHLMCQAQHRALMLPTHTLLWQQRGLLRRSRQVPPWWRCCSGRDSFGCSCQYHDIQQGQSHYSMDNPHTTKGTVTLLQGQSH